MHIVNSIEEIKELFKSQGIRKTQYQWQSIESPDDTYELCPVLFQYDIPSSLTQLQEETRCQLPWAEDHFQERIGGRPLNPGDQYKNWRFYKHKPEDDKFRHENDHQFSHSYMERFWPTWAGRFDDKDLKDANYMGDIPEPNRGIRYELGDYRDMIKLLSNDLTTRQAYLPIWFPEDTGNKSNVRVPCTIGYHFYINKGVLDCHYYIRSCDFLRHFRDDVYLACRLVQNIISKLNSSILPGKLYMHITSLHVFYNERKVVSMKNS